MKKIVLDVFAFSVNKETNEHRPCPSILHLYDWDTNFVEENLNRKISCGIDVRDHMIDGKFSGYP